MSDGRKVNLTAAPGTQFESETWDMPGPPAPYYERLTDGLHQYISPEPGTNINISRYVSNGYIVLRPDIVYRSGHPGESALKCVIPAVEAVVANGFIDPRRIGIQGHSWGAFEASYILTKTDMFRAAEAGGRRTISSAPTI